MITFIIALLVLVGGYFLYGSYVERVFGPDKLSPTGKEHMTIKLVLQICLTLVDYFYVKNCLPLI